MAENLAQLHSCLSVWWKIQHAHGEIGYLAEEIHKRSVERVAWFPLTAYSKMWEERNNLNKELLIKKKELKDLEILSYPYWKKWEELFKIEQKKNDFVNRSSGEVKSPK